MSSPVSGLTGVTDPNAAAPASAANGLSGKPPSEQMFLQLLVAQLQNQDPMSPTDSTQFVAQLAQFSELEQVIAIRGDIESLQASTAGQTPNTGQTQP